MIPDKSEWQKALEERLVKNFKVKFRHQLLQYAVLEVLVQILQCSLQEQASVS